MERTDYENKSRKLRRREFAWPARYTAPLCVRIAPEVKGRLDALADEAGISVGQIVRRILDEHLGLGKETDNERRNDDG